MAHDERSYREQVAKLGPLEAFDPAVFVGDSTCPQKVCDLVLALALAFNDLKDFLQAHWLFLGEDPGEDSTPTPELGCYNGLQQHFMRLELAYLWELTKLIRKSKDEWEHPFLENVLSQLPSGPSDAWKSVVAVAMSSTRTDPRLSFLVQARNKVAFHYDPTEIGRGYRSGFELSVGREPLVSRGESLPRARFYFADAAAQDYLHGVLGGERVETFFTGQSTLVTDIAQALYHITTRFITARGAAWRSWRHT